MELIVSVSIIVILMSVVLFQYRTFDNRFVLRSVAHEVALAIRTAQVYGVSVRGGGGDFEDMYGVHFDKNTMPTQYILFRDTDGGGDYDGGEAVTTFSLTRGNYVRNLEVATATPYMRGIDTLDILFKRPDPDALFSWSPRYDDVPAWWARIRLGNYKDPSGANDRHIEVWPTGYMRIR